MAAAASDRLPDPLAAFFFPVPVPGRDAPGQRPYIVCEGSGELPGRQA
jgi:hypothetical protein